VRWGQVEGPVEKELRADWDLARNFCRRSERSCAPTGPQRMASYRRLIGSSALLLLSAVAPATAAAGNATCAPTLVHHRADGWTISVAHGLQEECGNGTFVVRLRGPKGEEEAFSHRRLGALAELWVEDFDRDGLVEIAVETRQAGVGRAEVAVFAHGPLGWVEKRIVPLAGQPASGYRGGDHFAFVDGALVRRFHTYKPADADCCPTGPERSLGLAYGEGRWVPFEPRPPAPPTQPAPPSSAPPH